MKKTNQFVEYEGISCSEDEMLQRSNAYYQWLNKRRTIREFSDRTVPREIMENIVRTASTAPSGAHKQPWTFCLVESPEIKKKIREAAEKEEQENYNGRMSERWLDDLRPLGTDEHKPFLEKAPWLVVLFKKVYEMEDGEKRNNYYVNESVGLAAGFFITAVHNAGLVTLTHTPSPMNFLSKILNRPKNERPFLLLPVGYPATGAKVPDLKRKPLEEVLKYY